MNFAPPSPRARKRRWLRLAALASIALVLVAACSTPVGVRAAGFEVVYSELSRNVLDDGRPSARSREIIAYLGLTETLRTDPDEALARADAFAFAERRRGLIGAMAELHYARGLATGDKKSFFEAAIRAYLYLFSDECEPAANPYDAMFRLSCEIYNRALARTLLDESGEIRIESQVLARLDGSCTVEASRPGFPWDETEFSRFLPADNFLVRGLRERIRTAGIGVPLIAVRDEDARKAEFSGRVSRAQKLAATAILRLDGNLDAIAAGEARGALELYFTAEVSQVEIGGRQVPLESDLTAPLAYTLEDSPIWDFSLSGFFSGSLKRYPTGVYMLQPYQRGKIPIVLVHGTASNPAVWAQLINGLMFDPNLRGRYQIWLAIYNTGNPVLYSTAQIRSSLQDLVQTLDPGGSDPAISDTVIVGHSQGGLITRLLVSSSGDVIWSRISKKPFDEYPLKPADRELLRGCIFFEPLPFVKSVVFIATPHRGSYVAGGLLGRLAQLLAGLPGDLSRAASNFLKREDLPPELREGIPTSVQNMKPNSPFARNLERMPLASGLHIHSIIAVRGTGPHEKGNDGIVEYESAHLDQAESELVVRHGHSCQNEPATIIELRRILNEKLAGLAHGADGLRIEPAPARVP